MIETTDPNRAIELGKEQFFDCVVGLDVLGCLAEPERWLREVHSRMAPGSSLVLGIPNLRQHGLGSRTLNGAKTPQTRWRSNPDPIRLSTRQEIDKLLYRARFTVLQTRSILDPYHDVCSPDGCPAGIPAIARADRYWSASDAADVCPTYYLISATPTCLPEYDLTSIIVLTCNQLPYTRLCLESLQHYTDEPYELIVVDNGSTDGTLEYLRGLSGVTLIANHVNRGFPAGANQGMRVAKGGQVLLLNNDTVVTTGWLRRLLTPLMEDASIGLVGPCSNAVSGPQQVSATYQELDRVDEFAWQWGRAHEGTREKVQRLVGFCLLIRREVVDRVGLLDERFGIGCFEDDDYCLRATQAGYQAVIARDAFIHHFGSQTFRGGGLDLGALLDRNDKIFRSKWMGRPLVMTSQAASVEAGVPCAAAREPAGFEAAHAGSAIRLSLCMIVRDNARTIDQCLRSIRPWVDEMIVVDTGSLDDTPSIAEALGARTFHFPWCDDFSAARNESLRHACGEWLFWMDSDDVIDAENGCNLRELAERAHDSSTLGYVMQVHCPGPGREGAIHTTVVDHVKLIRNLPALRFEGRIHEQILLPIRRLGGKVEWSNIFVTHAGYDHSPEAQQRKRERDLRLLHLEHQERGEHPFTLFNLGMTYADMNLHRDAVDYLKRSIAHSRPGESHLRKAYALLAHSYNQAQDGMAAWETCRQGLQLFPDDIELRFREASLLHQQGRLEEAAHAYHMLLELVPERHLSSVDVGLGGFKARHNLAVVYGDLDRPDRAEEQWRLTVQEQPLYRAGWRGLAAALLQQGKTAEALKVASLLVGDPDLRVEGFVLQSEAALARNEWAEARRCLDQAISEHPDDSESRQQRCRFLFEHGAPGEAEGALEELIRRDPCDAAAYHNLGAAHLRAGRIEPAATALRKSLALRPDSVKTRELLEQAVGSWSMTPGNTEQSEHLLVATGA